MTTNIADRWIVSDNKISFYDKGHLVCRDTLDHWQNAFCRLLGLDETAARNFVESVGELSSTPFGTLNLDDQLSVLEAAGRNLEKILGCPDVGQALTGSMGPFGRTADRVWAAGLRENQTLAVVGTSDHGWLIDRSNPSKRLHSTVAYDSHYFQGGQKGLGYGDYAAQKGWRLEKSRRQVCQLKGLATYLGRSFDASSRFLDIGCGYGFFRCAVQEEGWRHEGIELSQHAVDICQENFGFSTFNGTVESYATTAPGYFHAMTMFDLIEHVDDPVTLLRLTMNMLTPNGFIAIRTPNLISAEYRIFRSLYHSFKAEHLHSFSPSSLVETVRQAGLEPLFLTSESHLLGPFIGRDITNLAAQLAGSDLFLIAGKSM